MKTWAIIIVYKGSEPSQEAVRKAIEGLISRVAVQDQTIQPIVFSEADIASSLLQLAIARNDVKVEVTGEPQFDATMAATIIGKQFGEHLRSMYTYQFNTNLMYSYVMACSKGNNNELVRAVEILANASIDDIDPAVVKEYAINSHHLDIISQIYNTTCAGHINL